MENKKSVSILLFAILGLSIISVIPNANAQLSPVKISGLGVNILEVHYQEATGILWALGGSRSVLGSASLLEINPVNNTLLNTYNISGGLDGGAPNDLWCSNTACFVTSRTATTVAPSATIGSVMRVESIVNKGIISGFYNSTTNDRGFGRIDGRDSTSSGFGGVALYTESYDNTGTLKYVILGGVGTINKTADLATTGTGGTNNVPTLDLQWTGIAGNTNNYLITSYTGANTIAVRIYNLSNVTTLCTSANIAVTAANWGGQLIMDIDNDKVYVANGSTGAYSTISTINCSITSNSITSTDTGLSGAIVQKNGIAVQSKDVMFFQESGANARTSSAEYDYTTQTFSGERSIIDISPGSAQTGLYGRAYLGVEHDTNGQIDSLAIIGSGSTAYNGIFIPMDADQAIFIFKFEAPTEPDEVLGINCDLPENAGILICRLTATTGGNIGGLGGIIDTGILSLFVNAGLIDGTDTNPQTNGVGYVITLVGFGILIAIFWLASGGRIKEIPTFVWMVASIALVGVITAIGWIDPTFFIVAVITIAALAAMQMRNMIDRGIDFSTGGNF